MVSFWESMTLVGTAATILGVFFTVQTMINNKILKKESRLTREAITEESKLTREMIKETVDYLGKYLGDLIVAEGNRTRVAIK